MRAAVMGTGEVGTAIATKLKELGHEVVMGSRHPGTAKSGIPVRSHADAVFQADWVFNAMHGEDAVDVFREVELAGKLLVDIGKFRSAIDGPLYYPLGELLQRTLPDTKVVKAMNFPSAQLMGHPKRLSEHHSVFVAGNEEAARNQVIQLLKEFGWQDIVDLGDLTACRAMESLTPMWVRLNKQLGHVWFNISTVRDADVDS